MHTAATWLFWTSAALAVYVYVGYPLCLWLVGRLRPGPVVRRNEEYRPHVTLVISAFNEEGVILEKLRNCGNLDYPVDRMEIVVVSDASEDRTDQLVEAWPDPRVKLLRMPERTGKTAGLNAAVAMARGEILVFSDANSMYAPHTILRLVRNLADPSVGAVTGEQRYEVAEAEHAAESESLYWRYEQAIKVLESRVGSVVGGDGAIYATRKSLYRPLRPDDLSDFVNPVQVIAGGHRNVYEDEAVAYEAGSSDFGKEYRRKVRIVNRAWRAVLRMPSILNPFQSGIFAWQVLSHKFLRWLMPFFQIDMFVSGVVLASGDQSLYAVLLLSQLLFYCAAGVGFLLRNSGRSPWVTRIPYYFCMVNVASLHGILDSLRGRTYTTWTTVRT